MKKFIKFVLFSIVYLGFASIVTKMVLPYDGGLRFLITYGSYLWGLIFYSIFHSRRMRRRKEMEDMVDSVVSEVMANVTNDPYPDLVFGNDNDEDDEDYYDTIEYKYEVMDSLSIRQIERYLELRKNYGPQK